MPICDRINLRQGKPTWATMRRICRFLPSTMAILSHVVGIFTRWRTGGFRCHKRIGSSFSSSFVLWRVKFSHLLASHLFQCLYLYVCCNIFYLQQISLGTFCILIFGIFGSWWRCDGVIEPTIISQ